MERKAPSLQELIAKLDQNPKALVQLAISLVARGDEARARELASRAVESAAGDPEVLSLAARVFSHGIPVWHFDLPFDRIRNAAYESALRRAIQPGVKIFEIGTGTGLLSMMAARAGAADVITCEAVPAIADIARQMIAKNGYSRQIRVLTRHSDDLDVDQDLGGPADVLVSEILANDVVGEKVLPTIERAKRRLLRPGARIIPARVVVCVALAHDPEMPYPRMADVEGFDLRDFNRLAPPRYRLPVNSRRIMRRSDSGHLFAFNFEADDSFPEARSEVALNAYGGAANCIVQWLRCEMDEAGWFENSPGSDGSSWALDVYPLREPIDTAVQSTVTIRGAHDRNTLTVWAATGEQRK